MTHDENMNDVEIISAYSRADALADGELIDVTPWAAADLTVLGGFDIPVAFTRALLCTASDFDFFSGEDVRARVLTILSLAYISYRLSKHPTSAFVHFRVLLTDSQRSLRPHDLILHAGPGDTCETVVTIGFPEDF